MRNKLRLDHKHMLAHYSKTLVETSIDRFEDESMRPYVSLVAAVMISSIKEGDKKYIYNGGLQAACIALQLKYKPIKFMFKDMHRIIKNNEEWSKG